MRRIFARYDAPRIGAVSNQRECKAYGASSPRRQLSRTNRRIALDRLPLRSASISVSSALTGIARRAAISHSACQNAGSSEMLVAWPAILTECLISAALFIDFEPRAR